MKHISPTPWRQIEQVSEVNFTHTIVDVEGEKLARVCSLSRAFNRQRDEGANAVLMAASPEIYACLKSCVATLKAQGITGPKVSESEQLLALLKGQLEDEEG